MVMIFVMIVVIGLKNILDIGISMVFVLKIIFFLNIIGLVIKNKVKNLIIILVIICLMCLCL